MPEWASNLLDNTIAKLVALIAAGLTLLGALGIGVRWVSRRLRNRYSGSQVRLWCKKLDDDLESVRLEAKQNLIHRGGKAVSPLVDTLREGTCRAQKLASEALCDIGGPALRPMLAARREKLTTDCVDEALQQYLPNVSQSDRVVEELIAMLEDCDPIVQEGAARALGQFPQSKVIRAPGRRVYPTECKNEDVRRTVVSSLGETKDPAAVAYLVIALKDHSPGVRQAACEALRDISTRKSNPALGQALREAIDALSSVLLPDFESRIEAARTLGCSANPTAAAILVRVQRDLPDDDFHRTLLKTVGTALSAMQPRGDTGG